MLCLSNTNVLTLEGSESKQKIQYTSMLCLVREALIATVQYGCVYVCVLVYEWVHVLQLDYNYCGKFESIVFFYSTCHCSYRK